MKNKNQPEIRFPDYKYAWEQCKINELMIFSNGINAPKENYGKGRKMISVMDIISENTLSYENIRNSVSVSKQIEEKNKVEFGDVVFVRSSEILEEVGWAKAYLDKNYALYSGFSIRGKRKAEFDPIFVERSLNGVGRKQIERKAGGSTRFNISQEILNSLAIRMPSFKEQTKVGTFFKQLDDTIALQQRQLERLKDSKQGFLQKMFPKDGERVPEVRFTGFSEDWMSHKLGDVSNHRGGVAIEKYFSEDGKYKVITIGSYKLDGTYNDQNIRTMSNKITDQRTVKKNELTMVLNDKTSTGEIIGRVLHIDSDDEYVVNQRTEIVSPNRGLDSRFAYTTFNGPFREKVKKIAQGGTQIYVNYSAVEKLNMDLPCKEEQQKIGEFFKQLDDTIALHEKELDLLKETKKAFLQKMFV